MADRYREQLRMQLGFLERSCASYDDGYVDEALRIAVVARTLVHQTKNSTSLLTHLGASEVRLLSTSMNIVARFASGDPFYGGAKMPRFFNGMGSYRPGSDSPYVPKLGDAYTKEYVLIVDWWEQPVMILQHVPLTRRDVVLTAANKDGGAHVDAKLTPEYEALIAPGSVGTLIREVDGGVSATPVTNGHLVALRQMGYELLNSPDLTMRAEERDSDATVQGT